MRRHLRFPGLVCALVMPHILLAQSIWTVTVTPTVNPLPVGSCGAVWVKVFDPKVRDTPRNPSGTLITLADFDLTVTTPDGKSMVGQYLDAYHWSVCGCQGGTVGAAGTITARYPGQLLSERTRVANVAFETTATVILAKAAGGWNPPGCPTPPPAAVIAAAGTPIAPVQSPAAPRTAMTSGGAAPTGVAVTGTPLTARVSWTAAPNAARYAVFRKDDVQLSVERTPAAFTATEFTETLPDPRITYRYTVVAYYANGTYGEAPAVQYTSPPLLNPTGLSLAIKGQTSTQAEVEFSWNAVPGAVQYRLDGPGIAGTGQHSTTTTAVVPNVPRGAGTWKVTALYPGNFADYPNGTTVSRVIRILPTPSQSWLTKNNGAGSQDNVQMPREGAYHCFSFFFCTYESVLPNQLQHPYDVNYATFLGASLELNYSRVTGLNAWLDWSLSDLSLWDDPLQIPKEAVYGNPGDLGVGRRSYCAQKTRTTQLPGLYTVCYAAAHGIAPGEPGFNDPAVITKPGEGQGDDFLLAMVITKEPGGMVFMVFGPTVASGPATGPVTKKYKLSPTVTLDTQGPKFVPHVCLSCHGGTYNATTHKVDGGSFLPIDPSLQSFATEAAKSAQQENIRRINAMIVASDPTSAVAAYIRGLYGNAVSVPGTSAIADYVPQGWQSQAGLYREVVRPYCAMCHLAAPSDLSFASWVNFESNAGRIKAAVCSAHTMPHAELQFREFWLKDTGPLYLPGLLAASLKFPAC